MFTCLCGLPLLSSVSMISLIVVLHIYVFYTLLLPPVNSSSHTTENHQAMGNPWRGIETEGKKKRIYSVLCAADQKHGSHMIKGI